MFNRKKQKPDFKFNEGALIEELLNYVSNTYSGHFNQRNLLLTVTMVWVLLWVMY